VQEDQLVEDRKPDNNLAKTLLRLQDLSKRTPREATSEIAAGLLAAIAWLLPEVVPEVGDYRFVNGSLRKYQAANVSSGRRLGFNASRRMRRQDLVKGEVVLASFLTVARRKIDPRTATGSLGVLVHKGTRTEGN
jgi:hypothetical protein